MNFVVRGEAILIGFLKGFFCQETLYQDVLNEFRYIDNMVQNSLIIEMSESYQDETVNAIPALIIQEGGFQEVIQATGSNLNHWGVNNESHITPYMHPYTIHCVAATKASAKLLQSATAKSISMFRKAIYALGVDNISELVGGPPLRLSRPDESKPGYYDCTINFRMKMDQDWFSDRTGDPVETIRIAIYEACQELTFDENGTPNEPIADWILQNISIQLDA